MLIEMDCYDMSELIKELGYEEHCDLLADYVDDCCCDGWDIKRWLANCYNSTIYCFENKEEALEFIEHEKRTLDEDCCWYTNSNYGVIVDLDY